MTIKLASELISKVSITPDDAGCQQLLATRLEKAGFTATHLRSDDVDNLWLTHGTSDPVFTFLGHTDVVPTGPLEAWQSDPFKPEIRDGYLYGRGAADMKGSIAAMVTAMERFVQEHPDHPGTISLLVTSDEEGPAINGVMKMVDYFKENHIDIKWCLVGEPSSAIKLGDTIKHGRRGSLTGTLTLSGTQGHVAYPEKADNPIHKFSPVLNELCDMVWDQGNEHYPATRFQVSNINAGTGASNVIPGGINVMFNFRYCTESTEEELIAKVRATLDKYDCRYDLDWLPSSKPFLTTGGQLLDGIIDAVQQVTGITQESSTTGGTSDGRFIAPTGAEVVELGPCNETIHKIDECVSVSDLEQLSIVYEKVLSNLFPK